MEDSYDIAVTNRYRLLLDDEEDPLEVLKAQEQKKEAKKKTKVSEKENEDKSKREAKLQQEPQKIVRKNVTETRQNVKSVATRKPVEEQKMKPPPQKAAQERIDNQRNVKFNETRDREERNNRRNQERAVPTDFTRDVGEFDSGRPDSGRPETGEGRFRGRGGRGLPMRGMRGGFGYEGRGGRRDYDRQSRSDKTGVKPIDKREGGGAHNWGNPRDDIQELATPSQNYGEWPNEELAAENSSKDPETAETGGEAAQTEGEAPKVEEETQPVDDDNARVLTLDEYYARKGNRQKPTFNIRKAGEGEDQSQWKKMYALTKKKEVDDEDDEEFFDVSEYPQRVGRQKYLLDIDIRFTDSRRGSRARGRRGMRGGGMRGAGPVGQTRVGGDRVGPYPDGSQIRDRYENQENIQDQNRSVYQQSAPKFDDDHDFPSLA